MVNKYTRMSSGMDDFSVPAGPPAASIIGIAPVSVANNSTAAIRRAIQTQTMSDFWQADAAYTRLLWYSYPSDADA